MVTLDAAALRVSGGDVQQDEELGNETEKGDANRSGSAMADLVRKLDVTGGDVQQSVVPGKEVESLDAQQDGLPAADLASPRRCLCRAMCPPRCKTRRRLGQRHGDRALDRYDERRQQGRSRAVRWKAQEARVAVWPMP